MVKPGDGDATHRKDMKLADGGFTGDGGTSDGGGMELATGRAGTGIIQEAGLACEEAAGVASGSNVGMVMS